CRGLGVDDVVGGAVVDGLVGVCEGVGGVVEGWGGEEGRGGEGGEGEGVVRDGVGGKYVGELVGGSEVVMGMEWE
ncbi:hypothetical protein, partial [Kocuria salsicia]|uniref:hypothetical protein n=1 Tax=Kocuria salsicia TaxID=664639 RepID=UPI001C93155B